MEPISALMLASLCTPHFHSRVLVRQVARRTQSVLAAVTPFFPSLNAGGYEWRITYEIPYAGGSRTYTVWTSQKPPAPDPLDVNYRTPDVGCEASTG